MAGKTSRRKAGIAAFRASRNAGMNSASSRLCKVNRSGTSQRRVLLLSTIESNPTNRSCIKTQTNPTNGEGGWISQPELHAAPSSTPASTALRLTLLVFLTVQDAASWQYNHGSQRNRRIA